MCVCVKCTVEQQHHKHQDQREVILMKVVVVVVVKVVMKVVMKIAKIGGSSGKVRMEDRPLAEKVLGSLLLRRCIFFFLKISLSSALSRCT